MQITNTSIPLFVIINVCDATIPPIEAYNNPTNSVRFTRCKSVDGEGASKFESNGSSSGSSVMTSDGFIVWGKEPSILNDDLFLLEVFDLNDDLIIEFNLVVTAIFMFFNILTRNCA
jgi:hypothetical protein